MLPLAARVLGAPEVELSADGLSLSFRGDGTITKAVAQSKGNPKGITRIDIDGPSVLGERAFGSFSSLEAIDIADTVEEIQQYCFESCSALVEFTFPKNIQAINSGLFHSCFSLSTVRFNSSVRSINTYELFRDCRSLALFYVSLENEAFSTDSSHRFVTSKDGSVLYCASAAPNQTIPALVTTVSSFCYSRQTIGSIDFSQSRVGTLKTKAFFILRIGELAFPRTLTRVGSMVFYQCTIDSVSLPPSLEYFDKESLLEVSALNELKVESSKALIDENGYIYNPQRTILYFVNPNVINIKVSSDVTYIELAAVRKPHVLNISVGSSNDGYSSHNGLLYNGNGTVLMACPGGKQDVAVSSKCLTIGNLAFRHCKVRTVRLNNGIRNINYQGFLGCSSLESINFPPSIQQIQSYAFADTTSLDVDAKFGPSLLAIGAQSFRKSKIRSIDLSECDQITTLEKRVFYNCGLRSARLPPRLNNLGEEAFLMSGVESIELGSTVTAISRGCFNGCRSLTRVEIGKAAINDIPESCFESSGIASIEIPSRVASISSRAFANCINLTSIAFSPDSNLTTIFPYIIDGCESLEAFTVPASVRVIGDGAFANSYGLLNFVQRGPSELFTVREGVLFTGSGDTLYAFPGGRPSASIDDSVKEIRALAFAGCASLVSVKFGAGSSIRALGESTFLGCSKLEEVALPGGLTSFVSSTFGGCRSIRSVRFEGESHLKEMPPFCFCMCSSLSYCEFPMSLERIGDSSFECCSLKRISLLNSTKIGKKAFFGCKLLESVWIRSSVSSIAKDSFDNCINLNTFSFCGAEFHDVGFNNCSLKIVLVANSYQHDKFGKLSVFRILDGDCLIPTQLFTNIRGANALGYLSLQEFVVSDNVNKRA